MEIERKLEIMEQLKGLALEVGKDSKERELMYSDYMEREYQEPDLDRGIALLKMYLHELLIDEQMEQMELEEMEREAKELAINQDDLVGEGI